MDLEQIFGPVANITRCAQKRRRTLEEVLQLAVEIAREGREGRKIGTLFVVGDVERVLERSRSMLLDPLHGHADEVLDVSLPEFRETVKELAQLDSAFLVRDRGTFAAAARYIEVDPRTGRARALPALARVVVHARRRRDAGPGGRDHRRGRRGVAEASRVCRRKRPRS